jgi:tetratricopeptide (TPR) repeat protein
MRDQYAQAIEISRDVLKTHPRYRSAIQANAHFLTLVGKDDEALELLTHGLKNAESASLACQLLDMQFERGMYYEARDTLEYCDQYSPLSDKNYKSWLAGRAADIALRLGEIDKAYSFAKSAGGIFYEQIAARLETPGAATKRILLPVGFVRQNYMTCAPATLTALCKYWGREVDHLEIAEKICYDGTPYQSERNWAEEQGYIATELTVDWNTARTLIDAGVPFALTTVHTGSGHLQAVIGYDELRGTLLIRDPFERTHGEFDAKKLFESHRSSGPRMLVLPREEAQRIAGVVLPDSDLWTSYFSLMSALQRHDRNTAAHFANTLAAHAPEHQLSINARRSLAMYDGDAPALLATTEALLVKFPDDGNLRLSKASSLQLLGTRAQQVAWLEQLALGSSPDPQMLIRFAGLLQEDDRESTRVGKLLGRALRMAPSNATGWYELASLLWHGGNKEAGLECYRIASCLHETNEEYASTYFRAGLFLKRRDTVLNYLRYRYARLGSKSAQPFMTLFQQMESVELTEEAFQLMQKALAANPNDSALVLFAADTYIRYGKISTADALLKRSTLPAKQAIALRTQSNLAREMNEPERALSLALEAVALEPLNLGHYRQTASIMMQLHGRARTIDFLRGACSRFSFHCGLHELMVEFLGGQPFSEIELVLRHLVSLNPNNLWAQRELATNLALQQRFDEAHRIMVLVCTIAPTQSSNFSNLAFVYIRQGNIQAARDNLRQALRLSIDNDYALSTLIDLSQTLEQRKEALAFIHAELIRQVTLGDALISFHSAARTTLAPEELLEIMRDALNQHPDLWQAWLALGSQLIDANKLPEALEHLENATKKFPLLPRAYLELSRAQVLSGRRDLARQTLKNALHINPHWPVAVRNYVNNILEEGADYAVALKALDVALARNPDNADLRGLRAEVLMRMDRREEAADEVQRAIKSNPALYWPWSLLRRMATELDDPKLTERIARELTISQPGDQWCWIRLAEFCVDPAEALAASEKAIELDPMGQTACETRLGILLRTGRHKELEKALGSLPWTDYVPVGVRVFEARLAREKGWRSSAAKKMRGLLDEDVNNYSLWSEYAEWCDSDEEYAPYLEAAENLLRLQPNYHVANGFYADAMIKNGRKKDAIPYFERAFGLDPSYSFAGYWLLDEALERSALDRASELLASLSLHSQDAALLARKVWFAALKQDQSQALKSAHTIFSQKGDTGWASRFAIEKIKDAGWHDQLVEQIKTSARAGHCSVRAVRYLIDDQGKGFSPSLYRDVKKLLQSDPHNTIKRGFLSCLIENRDYKVLDRFVADFGDALRRDLDCWCETGYAYLTQSHHTKAAAWMSRWQQRADTPAWALDNIALALRTIGSHDEARQASLRSLQLEPWNADAKTWLAVDAARLSRQEELSRLLAEIDGAKLSGYFQALRRIAQHWLEVWKAPSIPSSWPICARYGLRLIPALRRRH